jgi:sugar phosphate isomerase/epimerase/nitrogen-specific signal transduction histidine kinase
MTMLLRLDLERLASYKFFVFEMTAKDYIAGLKDVKIAVETVLWKEGIQNLAEVFETISAYGCKGIEFSHWPTQIGNSQTLMRLLNDFGLTLVGLSGGTLHERVEFCGDILRPEYLYVENWDDNGCKMAIDAGFVLALHPHLFKPIHRLQDAEKLLIEHEELRFLPDIAHLEIAGDSLANALSRWRHRLAAIHLKDWTPIYGRSSHRYGRGFVELGDGIINFDQFFKSLKNIDYAGWLVIEQGRPESSPQKVLAHATEWFGLNMQPPRRKRIEIEPKSPSSIAVTQTPQINAARNSDLFSDAEHREFVQTIFYTATEETTDCYPRLTEALGKLLKPKLILLCACNPPADVMGILGIYPPATKLKMNFMKYQGSLSSVAVELQRLTVFDLESTEPAAIFNRPNARFGYPILIKKMDLKKLISVPILNPQNPHQARFVVNVFPGNKSLEAFSSDLLCLGSLIGQAADAALDERCALAAATVSLSAGNCQQADAFLKDLLDLLLKTLHCEALTIFLVNDIGDRLEAAKSTGLHWDAPPEDRFYRLNKDNDLAATVWQRREAMISANTRGSMNIRPKSNEYKSRNSSCLCAPMVDVKGTVIGVIRCQNKRSEPESYNMFSEDDLAVLDAACQAAVPHLQVLLSKERRAKALRRLTHELNYPLVALAGATERIKNELLRRHGTSEAFFSEDYIGDIESWMDLMKALIGNADLFRLADREIVREQSRVHLYGDVIMPVVNQIKKLLDDRDFIPNHIYTTQFETIPRLWLDKKSICQVVFNLLSNAIKYAYPDPKRFRIEIRERETARFYEIDFCDWGPGIDPEIKEAIFMEGVRSKQAAQSNVSGDGLGLWLVRRVVQAHGGNVELTSSSNPTTFTIFLPRSLVRKKIDEVDD